MEAIKYQQREFLGKMAQTHTWIYTPAEPRISFDTFFKHYLDRRCFLRGIPVMVNSFQIDQRLGDLREITITLSYLDPVTNQPTLSDMEYVEFINTCVFEDECHVQEHTNVLEQHIEKICQKLQTCMGYPQLIQITDVPLSERITSAIPFCIDKTQDDTACYYVFVYHQYVQQMYETGIVQFGKVVAITSDTLLEDEYEYTVFDITLAVKSYRWYIHREYNANKTMNLILSRFYRDDPRINAVLTKAQWLCQS